MAISLPRFQQSAALTDSDGRPSTAFHIWWDTFAKKLEDTLTDLSDVQADILAVQAEQASQLTLIVEAQADIVEAQADIVAAQADIAAVQADQADQLTQIEALQADMLDRITEIEAAQAIADAAQLQADIARRNDKISASATVPTSILTATDAGTDATITVASHKRLYGDGSVIPIVAGGSITGLAYSTTYAVYYDDPTASTTTPSYVATSTLVDAQPNLVDGRHYCGQVTTPASGAGPSSGDGPHPPGGGGPYP